MDSSLWVLGGVVFAAALASPLGGLVAIFLPPSSLFLSIAVGFAGGALIGTLSFEMIPRALELIDVPVVVLAIAVGVGIAYGIDLIINRGRVAGEAAEEEPSVEQFHRRHRPWGTKITVLAVATASEELIEGVTIGVGGSIGPGTALVVGAAIAVDNLSEALSIGALAREENGKTARRRTLFWTSFVGLSLFCSAMLGLMLLRDLPQAVLAFLLATGAGAMFYLTVTDLLPEAERHQFQQSAALAASAGLLTVLMLSQVRGS